VTLDRLQVLFWVGFAFAGLAACLSQRRNCDHFYANKLIGLAFGTPGVFFLTALGYFGTVEEVRMWAVATRIVLLVYPLQFLIMSWALYLVYRANTARAGSEITWWGGIRRPTAEAVENALLVVGRGLRHGIINGLTARWGREEYAIRRLVAMAEARNGPNGRTGTMRDQARLLWRVFARRMYRRLVVRAARGTPSRRRKGAR
jgi:hypothetical protein